MLMNVIRGGVFNSLLLLGLLVVLALSNAPGW